MEIRLCERLKELVDDDKIAELCSAIEIDKSQFYRWRDGTRLPSVINAVKLAEYFGYSLDFILGISEDDRKAEFKPCADFSVRLKTIMREKNTNPHRLSREARVGRKTIYEWLAGKSPSVTSIVILASFFDCTVDYLLGRE